MRKGGEVITAVVGALFPVRCAGCGRVADPVCPVCPACAAGLRPAPALAVPPALDGWVAAFAYEGVAREIVARVKYRNERGPLPWLADAMARALPEHPGPAAVVTWAPASSGRRRSSGFDHGELLARAVARRLHLPAARLLVRAPGPAQTGLGRAARGPGPPLRPAGAGARRTVLLVDDVVTTGATLGAAAGALRRGGARRVVAVTAAATPPRAW
jgi:predicted amidophosphoribosyltransferase